MIQDIEIIGFTNNDGIIKQLLSRILLILKMEWN